MNTEPSPQEQLGMAFDNYFDLSPVLRADMNALLDCETETQNWRRNFIRASAPLIEGYAHCLRKMCAVSLKCTGVPTITDEEKKVIQSEKTERKYSAVDRIEFTLSAAYKLFELRPAPNFGNNKEWSDAQRLFEKRNGLMHPKTPADLEVADALWHELRDGVAWLMEQLFKFFSLLQEKHEKHPQSDDGTKLKNFTPKSGP